MSRKGATYEREICRKLSLWWTLGKRDDVFWRGDSGARAKRRGRMGKNTYGMHGDILAIDPVGNLLVRYVTIELKRGYSKYTIADMLDCSEGSAIQTWRKWYDQVTESMIQAEARYWAIINKRNRRDALIFFPMKLWYLLIPKGSTDIPTPFGCFRLKMDDGILANIGCVRLNDFLETISPLVLKKKLKELS